MERSHEVITGNTGAATVPATGKSRLSRRKWLRRGAMAGAAAGIALAGAGCRDIQQAVQGATGPTPPKWGPLPPESARVTQAVHVLNRAAFGPRPGDVAHVAEIGAAEWIEEQLAVTKPEQAYRALQKQSLRLPRVRRSGPRAKLDLPEAEDFDPDEDPAVRWRVGGLDIHQLEAEDPDQIYVQDDSQLVREDRPGRAAASDL